MADLSPLYLRPEALLRDLERFEAATQGLAARARAARAAAGLSEMDHQILARVSRAPGLDAAALCRALDCPKQTLSRLLARLGARGLLAPGVDARDRRRRPLNLTREGEAALAALAAGPLAAFAEACRRAGPQAVAGFHRVLDCLEPGP